MLLLGLAAAAAPLAAREPLATGLPAWPGAAAMAAAGATPAEWPPADDDGALVPDDATLEARGAVIGEVIVRTDDIFDTSDPVEDKALFRLANRLHVTTRERVILQTLLFETGSPYSRRVLEESERLLRATRYLWDAQIRPIRYYSNRVDVEVVSRDVWTLTAGLGLSRSGGKNSTRFQIQDTNFLGTGRDLSLKRLSDVDRSRQLLKYRDLNLRGTHTELELWLSENSDGSLQRIKLDRPFVSLDSHWAAGLNVFEDDRIDNTYGRGQKLGSYRTGQTYLELYAGRSAGLGESGSSHRWTAGFTYDRNLFTRDPEVRPPARLPEDRTLAYPWVGYQWVQDRFLEAHDLDQLQRTEDLYVGRSFRARLGWSPEALTSESDRTIFSLGFRTGLSPGRSLVLLDTELSGRWSQGDTENVIGSVGARFYRRNFGHHLLYATLRFDAADKLDGEKQLLIGGDSGLRGYPLRYQDGDRRALFTVEQRFYTDWHLFRLLHVGAAVFFDVGRAWFDAKNDFSAKAGYDAGVLRDIGLGLRLASSRSGQGAMIHLDLAFPLDGDASIDRVQWLVSTKETF